MEKNDYVKALVSWKEGTNKPLLFTYEVSLLADTRGS
jgi:hypothetical protein